MKKALIITAIIVVVLVAAYFIRRATTKRYKVVKPLYFFYDKEMKEKTGDIVAPSGTVIDKSKEPWSQITFGEEDGVGTAFVDGRNHYFDKSCVKPLIF